ncbi:MAG: 30S ribosomal protein S1 [Methylohalobius sp.]|nr:30S ribosomal protein S1 [Methylohalobius sp.]
MGESFAELFEESLAKTEMRPGTLLRAKVVDITPDAVIVDAGLKSEGIIPKWQFLDEHGRLEVGVGDEVEVSLDLVEDGMGATLLSRDKARRLRAWERLEEAHAKGEIVKGRITGKVRGGFTVEVGPLRAFLPGSLIDVRPVRDTGHLEGQELEFKVIKLDPKRNNIVLSRRSAVEQGHSAEREELLRKIKEEGVVKGVVKNITDYGAFIDLGGIDGLLHITDMAWKRIRHPSEVVKIGDEIEVKVLKFDEEKQRVSLGLKQLSEDPWRDITRRYPPGTRLIGKVTNLTDYGCFVELEDGVEGLVHVSEMDWTNKNVNPAKLVQVGDEVEVMVLDIDEERRRISLGIKQCKPNPWEEFAATHEKGEKIRGAIKSITDFGIFVGLPGGIDGLIHVSDISWSEPGEEAIRKFKKGQEVEAVILAIDPERERISLGIKQLEQDPFQNFLASHERGSIVQGKVVEVAASGAVVELADGVLGHLRASEIKRDKVEDARSFLKEGDLIEAKFIGVDKKTKMILLSIKAKEEEEEKLAVKDYAQQSVGAPTLGDLFKEQMEE